MPSFCGCSKEGVTNRDTREKDEEKQVHKHPSNQK